MKLNNFSYIHKRVRLLCFQLESLSGMKLVTELSKDFQQIKFIDKFGYIIVDYEKMASYSLSHTISNPEWETIQDMMLYLAWLDTGLNWVEKRKERSKRKE